MPQNLYFVFIPIIMKQRIAYIDQIKNFLTCLVVAHHAAQAYGPTGGVWVVNDASKAQWMGQFFFINASYMMGLYFFISGYFMVFSTTRKTNAAFFKDRLKRLGLPLLFFTLLVFLPFHYYGSGAKGSPLSLLADNYLNHPPLATGHLWFVASLLAYSIVFILFFKNYFSKQSLRISKFRYYYIPVYILLLSTASALIRVYYPIDKWVTWLIPLEPAHLPQYFSLFLLGAWFNYKKWLDQLTLPIGITMGLIAGASFIFTMFLPSEIKQNIVAESVMESILCVGISLFILTAFRHFGNKTNRFLDVLSANSYGIYLFHLLLVIFVQQLILNWQMNANLKFAFTTAAGILLSLGLSALLRSSKTIRSII